MSARKDKKVFCDNMVAEAEQAADKRDLNILYKITRKLSTKKSNQNSPVTESDKITKKEIHR
ncbi:hypothetical protein DPMN_173224 [Dreissena polymorpha]|uniref:Uncharacterized protein n=1 Tax=Dreissena polymorpha TaxID=45954 RepID=A0A9D4E3P6_DREPO|nr:hypothetical protein DPMN_173222 [Dreissena polymorpha]KAH3771895.1 hypothetical protein DPMN_173224 [Dreissena polymorpha]